MTIVDGMGLVYDKVASTKMGDPRVTGRLSWCPRAASAWSPNYRLLLRLMERAATIMGTESPVLLIEEYELNKQTLGGGEGGRRCAPS